MGEAGGQGKLSKLMFNLSNKKHKQNNKLINKHKHKHKHTIDTCSVYFQAASKLIRSKIKIKKSLKKVVTQRNISQSRNAKKIFFASTVLGCSGP